MTAAAPSETRRRFRFPWWAWTLTAIAVVAGIVALLGGFNAVPIEKLPKIELGEAINGTELRTTIDGVYLADTAPGSGTEAGQDDNGNDLQYLVVDATLENVTHATTSFSYDAVRVLLGDTIAVTDDPDNLLEARSGDSLSSLQPGMPTSVEFLWKVPKADVSTGEDVILGVFVRNALKGDPVFGDEAFSSPTPIARIVTTIGSAP
ncbi:MAG: hypothetical protein ABJB03_04895 [Rhodoglobus sp.]